MDINARIIVAIAGTLSLAPAIAQADECLELQDRVETEIDYHLTNPNPGMEDFSTTNSN
ncbi:hypothetical protein [Nannocystis pusilla]|uniref:hypothetical protein n=1 Tax=Nannocystis pusilla TaxID=889268 RepID=UPI003B78C879